jgi:nucleoid DNA-binding protein
MVGRAIQYNKIHLAVNVIIDQLAFDLSENQAISVRRFGTLSPYVRKGRTAYNVSTGEMHETDNTTLVKFHAHESFTLLLQDKKVRFRKNLQKTGSEEKGKKNLDY